MGAHLGKVLQANAGLDLLIYLGGQKMVEGWFKNINSQLSPVARKELASAVSACRKDQRGNHTLVFLVVFLG